MDSFKGQSGLDGAPGEKGDRGWDGENGLPGSPGEKGDRGYSGAVGLMGAVGYPGPKGERGDDCIEPPMGPKGDRGYPGTCKHNFYFKLIFLWRLLKFFTLIVHKLIQLQQVI